MSTDTTKPATKTVKGTLDSLTGYDELAIDELFGDVYELGGTILLRALQWLDQRRPADVTDQQAYDTVMAMRSDEVSRFFRVLTDEEKSKVDELDELDDGLIGPDELSPSGEGDSSSD